MHESRIQKTLSRAELLGVSEGTIEKPFEVYNSCPPKKYELDTFVHERRTSIETFNVISGVVTSKESDVEKVEIRENDSDLAYASNSNTFLNKKTPVQPLKVDQKEPGHDE
jgi:hypothetical protein